MQNQEEGSINQVLEKKPKEKQLVKPSVRFIGALTVVLVALGATLLHHFAFSHPRTTLLYDARSYLSSTASIAQCLRSILTGHPDFSPITNKQFTAAIVNDGPVLTGTFAAIFTLLGHIPQNKDWPTFEIIQSVMHSITSLLIYLSARRAAKVEAAALVAGLLFATYPAAVINTGRYYNETLMLLLASAALYFAGRSPATTGSTILGSYFSGLVFLMKPALVAGAGLSYLGQLLSAVSKPRALALVAAGIVLAFGPWAMYTKATMGKAYFTTPRNSGYNFAMGNDTEVDGAVTSPMPPLTSIYVNDPQPIHFMFAQWVFNTGNYMTMFTRKITRMYSNPWNDFRHQYFGLTAEAQKWWHLLLLFAGLTGVLTFVGERLTRNKLEYKDNSTWSLALGWMASPTIYLLFEANTRYGFTITPFLALFAALPVARLCQKYGPETNENGTKKGNRERFVLAGAIALGLGATLLIAGFDDISRAGQSHETETVLGPNEAAEKVLAITPDHKEALPGMHAFVMVDGDERLSKAKVFFNGKEIPGALTHLRYYWPSKYSEYYVFHELGYCMDELPENFRQWRIVEIPAGLINWQGENKITLRAGDQGVLLYGESDGNTRRYLSPLFYSPVKLGNFQKGLETRVVMPEIKADIKQHSSKLAAGGNAAPVPVSGALRMHLVLADQLKADAPVPGPEITSKWPEMGKHFDITIKDFDQCFSTGKPNILHTSRHVVDAAHSVCSEFSLPAPDQANAVHVKLTGQIKANRDGSKVGLLVASRNKAGQPVLLSRTPPYVSAGTQWQSFTIEDVLPRGELVDGPVPVMVGVYPGPWEEICGYSCDRHSADAIIKDMKMDLAPAYQLNLTTYRLIVL